MTKYRKILLAVLAGASITALTACETMNRTMVEIKDKTSEWGSSLADSDIGMPEMDTSKATMKTDQEESIPPVEQIVRSDMPMAREPVQAMAPMPGENSNNSDAYSAQTGKTIIINSKGASTVDSTTAFDKLAPLEEKSVVYTGGAHEQAASISGMPVAPLSGKRETCPDIVLVGELRQFHQFENPATPSAGQKISSLIMTDSKAECVRNADNIVVDIALDFRGELGPKALLRQSAPSLSYPYFIAVTSPNGNIISKEVFDVTMTYMAGQAQLSRTENIRHVIPFQGEAYDGAVELMIGFQLSEAELAYNRSLGTAAAAPAPEVPKKKASVVAPKKTVVKTETVYEAPAPKPEAKPVAAPAPEAAAPSSSPAAPGPASVESSRIAPVAPAAPASTQSMEDTAADLEQEIDQMPAQPEAQPAPASDEAIDITAP